MAEKILVVDDDLDTLRLVGLLLQRKGYQIVAADNGFQAIEKARTDQPDLILLDIMMPDMDGVEVLRRLRSSSDTSQIPIIMFTAKAQVDDKVTGFEAGADDYLTKPTHPAELTARVRSILSRSTRKSSVLDATSVAPRTRGRVICVIGAKGGLGTSTVAINLGITLHRTTGGSTVVSEFRPGSGSLGLMLGVRLDGSLISMLRKEPAAINEIDLQNALVPHESGLQLLLSSYQPGDARYIGAGDQMTAIANQLANMFDNVVLDLGAGLTPSASKVIEKADRIVVVIEPIASTVAQAKALVEELRMKVLGLEAIQVVQVSRVRLNEQLTLREIQNQLGHSVTAIIAADPDLAYRSLTEETPIVMLAPDTNMAVQFKKIAEAVKSG